MAQAVTIIASYVGTPHNTVVGLQQYFVDRAAYCKQDTTYLCAHMPTDNYIICNLDNFIRLWFAQIRAVAVFDLTNNY